MAAFNGQRRVNKVETLRKLIFTPLFFFALSSLIYATPVSRGGVQTKSQSRNQDCLSLPLSFPGEKLDKDWARRSFAPVFFVLVELRATRTNLIFVWRQVSNCSTLLSFRLSLSLEHRRNTNQMMPPRRLVVVAVAAVVVALLSAAADARSLSQSSPLFVTPTSALSSLSAPAAAVVVEATPSKYDSRDPLVVLPRVIEEKATAENPAAAVVAPFLDEDKEIESLIEAALEAEADVKSNSAAAAPVLAAPFALESASAALEPAPAAAIEDAGASSDPEAEAAVLEALFDGSDEDGVQLLADRIDVREAALEETQPPAGAAEALAEATTAVRTSQNGNLISPPTASLASNDAAAGAKAGAEAEVEENAAIDALISTAMEEVMVEDVREQQEQAAAAASAATAAAAAPAAAQDAPAAPAVVIVARAAAPAAAAAAATRPDEKSAAEETVDVQTAADEAAAALLAASSASAASSAASESSSPRLLSSAGVAGAAAPHAAREEEDFEIVRYPNHF